MKTTESSGSRTGPSGPGFRPDELEAELKQLIINALKLEGLTAGEIDRDLPLFFEGLGLDSIDGLELGMALEERYGIQVDAGSDENAARFASVRALAAFVASQRVR